MQPGNYWSISESDRAHYFPSVTVEKYCRCEGGVVSKENVVIQVGKMCFIKPEKLIRVNWGVCGKNRPIPARFRKAISSVPPLWCISCTKCRFRLSRYCSRPQNIRISEVSACCTALRGTGLVYAFLPHNHFN